MTKNTTKETPIKKQQNKPWTNKAPSWLYLVLPPVLLSALTWLFYLPSLHYDFQFDDIANIKKFFNIRHETLRTLFFTGTRWISYWINTINYSIAKFNPFIYRVGNVTYHCITGTLCFLVMYNALTRLKKENFFTKNAFWISCITAGLFLLHPVQTQTVSYVIQGQLEGLATLFTLAITYCFLKITQTTNQKTKIALTVLFYALAALSTGTKEITIMAPFLVLLTDWFFVAQGNFNDMKKRWYLHLGLFLIIYTCYAFLMKKGFFKNLFTLDMQARNNIGNVLTENQADKILPFPFFISQFKVILHYIWMFIWPFGICVEYDWKISKSFFAIDSFFPFLILCALAFGVYYLLKKDKTNLISFAALWFAIGVAPRSSFIPSSELLTDYKTYLPSVGIFFLLASILVKVFNVLLPKLKNMPITQPQMRVAAISLLFLVVGFGSFSRNKVWRSGLDFWNNIIENAPGKARAYNNYGTALANANRVKDAVPFYKKAIQMDRNYPDPWNNLAVAYSMMEKVDLAIATLREGLKINKYHPEGYNNLASFFIMKKKYEEAKKVLNVALRLRPYYGKAFFNYGKLYLEQGDKEMAFEYFKKACTQGDLDNEPGFKVYARVSTHVKRYEDAIFAYRKLLEMNPTSSEYYTGLANAHLLNKQFNEAASIYHRLVMQQPNNGRLQFNVGECYYQQKRYSIALDHFETAEKLKYPMPNLYLRLAACYETLGQPQESKRALNILVNRPGLPQSVKNSVQATLAQLDKKYNMAQQTSA